jgi:hypothetical protein
MGNNLIVRGGDVILKDNNFYSNQSITSSFDSDNDIINVNNTFVSGNIIYYTSSGWFLSQANSLETSKVFGIIQTASSTQFEVVYVGNANVKNHGFPTGSTLYLSDSVAGGISVSQSNIIPIQVGWVKDQNNIIIQPNYLINLSSSYSNTASYVPNVTSINTSFTSSYLTTQSFNSLTSSMYVLSSSFASTASYALNSSSATSVLSFRNKIINGDMNVWQRGTSFSSAGYTADRWYSTTTSTTVASASYPFSKSLQFSGVSMTNAGIYQRIESINCYDLYNKDIVISFYAESTAGSTQLAVALYYANSTDDFSSVTQVGSTSYVTLTGSWARYQITIPASSMISSITHGLQLLFFRNGTETNTTLITGIQMEVGTVATTFENRPIGLETSLCQRYFQILTTGAISGYMASTTVAYFSYVYIVPMRTTPTITNVGNQFLIQTYGVNGTPTNMGIVVSGNTTATFSMYGGTVSGNVGYGASCFFNWAGTAYITFTSEL